jgi:thymidine phosphorylase
MLILAKVTRNRASARRLLREKLDSGEALSVFRKMVEAHGGDPRVIDEPHRLPTAKSQSVVTASRSGFIHGIDPLALAHVALDLGAGRRRAEDTIDPAVGIELHVGRGQKVSAGDKIATLHQNGKNADLRRRTQEAFEIKKGKYHPSDLTLAVLDKLPRRRGRSG